MLNHMQSAIDSKLQNIRNMSHLLLLDQNFLGLSNAWGTEEEPLLAQTCYEELKSYQYVYNDISILIYFPNQDYILASGVSNNSASIYNSMKYTSHSPMPAYNQWISLIGADFTKASYFFSDSLSYNNAGTTSVVFACTTPFAHQKKNSFNILVSSPIDFIHTELSSLLGRTLMICSENGDIIQQFGAKINGITNLSLTSPHQTLSDSSYYCNFTPSEATGWTYVLCTPHALYLHDSIFMRNFTILSTMVSLIIGIGLIIYTQYRNYRPVKEILNIIPTSMKFQEVNEFEQIELYHGEMQRLNLFMKNKLQNISNNVRELYFYSKLKGVNFHTHENDIVNALDLNFSEKNFVIASIYADDHDFQPDDVMKNWQLLQFAIGNVSEEILQTTISDQSFYHHQPHVQRF